MKILKQVDWAFNLDCWQCVDFPLEIKTEPTIEGHVYVCWINDEKVRGHITTTLDIFKEMVVRIYCSKNNIKAIEEDEPDYFNYMNAPDYSDWSRLIGNLLLERPAARELGTDLLKILTHYFRGSTFEKIPVQSLEEMLEGKRFFNIHDEDNDEDE